ncbi:MAG: TraB/GumN family protein [Bacteroidota bacterium]
MQTFCRAILLLLLLTGSSISYGQIDEKKEKTSAEPAEDSPTLLAETPRDDYALLWEITGNGLPAPSYVFGSMHVRFKSVFEFPDSLLICLQNCTAIANEIQLDSAMQRIYEVRLGQAELNVDSVYRAITAQPSALTDSLNKSFAAENDVDPKDIRDLLRNVKQYSDLEDRGEMRTMLDAYLMDQARSMGLNTYGLEIIDHHLYHPNVETVAPTPLKTFVYMSASNSLIDMYYEGNIAAMDTLIRSSPEFYEQVSLIPRNYIMVERMLDIMHDENEQLFAVVGSAHLPGPEGVIDLLKDRGYTLRRVTPEFTGLRDSIQVTDMPRPWAAIQADRNAYTYGLPFPDMAYTHTADVAETTYCFDIGRGLTYTVSQHPLPVTFDTNVDELLFTNEGMKITDKDTTLVNGLVGTRYELEQYGEMEHALAYVFERDNELYVLKVEAYLEEELQNTDVQTFVNYFQLNTQSNGKWTTVVDSVGGFRARLPRHYKYTYARESDSYYGFDPHAYYPYGVYRAHFSEPNAGVRIAYYDYEPSGRPSPVTDRLEAAAQYSGNNWNMDITIEHRDTLAEFPSFTFKGESYDTDLRLKGKAILKGNRIYLLSQVDDRQQSQTKKLLNSFQLLENEAAPYAYHEMAKGAVAFYLPAEANESELEPREQTLDITSENAFRTTILDPNTGASFFTDVYQAPPLFGIADTTQFFDDALSVFIDTERDSLLSSKSILVADKFPGREVMYHLPERRIILKAQTYTAGNYWVRKRLYALPTTVAGAAAMRYFNEDRWVDSIQTAELVGSQAPALLAKLRSTDTLDLNAGLAAFSAKASVVTEDIPQLADLLQHQAHWRGWNQRLAAQRRLIDAIGQRDEGVSALADLYTDSNGQDTLRADILNHLSNYQIDSLETVFDLLTESPLMGDHPYVFDGFLRTTILDEDRFTRHWPQLREIIENGEVPQRIWHILGDGLAQGVIDSTFFLAYQDALLAAGENSLRQATANDRTLIQDILQIYQTLNPISPRLLAQAQRYFLQTSPGFQSVAGAELLLRAEQKLDKRQVKTLLRDNKLRGAMLRVLNENDQLRLGKSYFDQQLIAKDMLTERFLRDDLTDYRQLRHQGTIEVLHEGEPCAVHLFTFATEDTDNRLAAVGFFANNTKTPLPFLDNDWVQYTYTSVSKQQWEERGKRLAAQMSNGEEEYDFDFDFNY